MAPNTDPYTRALIVTLKSPFGGKSTAQISAITGISPRTIDSIYGRACQRGFEPNSPTIKLLPEYLEDAPRAGRPHKQEAIHNATLSQVCRDRYGREKSCADIAGDLSVHGYNISSTTVWRVLKAAGYNKTKPTRKPGLTKKMRQERLEWCLAHQDWTLEDWKNVIWSDETSVVLNHRRGGYRVWRKPDEVFTKTVIREQWKGYSEFMFWGCFSYDHKGPCHIWCPETAQQKREAALQIEEMNKVLEPIMRQEWELTTGMKRMGLRNKPGRTPQWRWTKETGKLSRDSGRGIDWWRYQTQVLIPKLIPFAKECQKGRPCTVVQEDKAPSHAHYAQQLVYSREGVEKLLWCGNSPDLNAIEAAWPWLKRRTTRKGALKNRAEGTKAWLEAWDELPQHQIQAWIERIQFHVKEIIRLEGGNEYKEGRRDRTVQASVVLRQ
ncbi:Tc1 [Pyrenophora tritici-repentis]|uniref:Tc1 n=1 Tax=Pyrenophora tritici-repentis TaxID=45151 RepID=A0A922SXF6_9PLEO|nr:Tc1 [Pyrenophora tritici-repentis]KAI1689848.1 Tc1 [Pyrenophora tritici-repentis]